ncbi:GNAT family N-acetyltransferase [Nocardioides sp. NPDC057772]|uniref:GNAT family N-acetyltransferase n=1 Tax=Nocardioides sp. NPDC057772 TaxID=3346245 RepID=UPI0036707442
MPDGATIRAPFALRELGNMATDSPHVTSKLEGPIRDAYRALRALVPSAYETAVDDELLAVVIDDLDAIYRAAQEVIDAEHGPRMSWPGDLNDGEDFPPFTIIVSDFDTGVHSDPAGAHCVEAWSAEEWRETARARAALAYKRESRWDVPPGPDGIWVIATSPYQLTNDTFLGTLVGFVVVHDRDHDGAYESIAHIWTASAWRRRGIAEQMIRTARDLMPINAVEAPITANGRALLGSVANDLLD